MINEENGGPVGVKKLTGLRVKIVFCPDGKLK